MAIGKTAALVTIVGNRFGIGTGTPGSASLILDGNIISNPGGTAPEIHGSIQHTSGTTELRSVSSGITALAGGGQSSTTPVITEGITQITTVATTSDSVMLPVAVKGDGRTVINESATAAAIFPSSGAQINALGANVSFPSSAGAITNFTAVNSSQWYSK